MLQQTQVKTVIPYWQRWMRRLPDVRTLARAPVDKVLKLWEGLGYYARARNLREAALIIVRKHGGQFPARFADLLALPGIGPYTAGAICSVALNQPTPVLDGNVIRVLTRIFGIAENPRGKKPGARLWKLAGLLVRQAARQQRRPGPHLAMNPLVGQASRLSGSTRYPPALTGKMPVLHHRQDACATSRCGLGCHTGTAQPNCSHFNQALMELGAMICTPRRPKCSLCPVRKHCVAFRENRTDQLPNLGKRVASIERRFAAFVVERHGRFLVRRRPPGVVNALLWEFPAIEVEGCRPDGQRLAENLLGARPFRARPLHQLRYMITRYRIRMHVFRAEFADALPEAIPNGRWCSPVELRRLAFPSAHRRILKLIQGGSGRRNE